MTNWKKKNPATVYTLWSFKMIAYCIAKAIWFWINITETACVIFHDYLIWCLSASFSTENTSMLRKFGLSSILHTIYRGRCDAMYFSKREFIHSEQSVLLHWRHIRTINRLAYYTEWWYQLCAGPAPHYRTGSLPPGWSWTQSMYRWVSWFWSCTGLLSPSLIAQRHEESVWPSSGKQTSSRALSPDSFNYCPHHCITRKLMERGKWKSKRWKMDKEKKKCIPSSENLVKRERHVQIFRS